MLLALLLFRDATGSVGVVLLIQLATLFVLSLSIGIGLSIFFSPRERAQRKWRRKTKHVYGHL